MRLPSWLPCAAALLLVACDTKNPNGMPNQPAGQSAVQALPATAPKPDPAAARAENPVMPADTTVAGAWLLLEGALRGHEAQVLNQLIDPELGLWILEQTGTVPVVTQVADMLAFRQASRFFPWISS